MNLAQSVAAAIFPGYREVLNWKLREEEAMMRLVACVAYTEATVIMPLIEDEIDRRAALFASWYARDPGVPDRIAAIESVTRDVQAGVFA